MMEVILLFVFLWILVFSVIGVGAKLDGAVDKGVAKVHSCEELLKNPRPEGMSWDDFTEGLHKERWEKLNRAKSDLRINRRIYWGYFLAHIALCFFAFLYGISLWSNRFQL